MERSEGSLCKAGARAGSKERRHRPPCRSESSAGRAICRADGPGRGLEPRCPRGRVVKAFASPPPHPIPSPQPVTEAPNQTKVTSTRKTARSKKPKPKPVAAPKSAAAKPKKKPFAIVKTAAAKPTTHKLVVPTLSSSNSLEEISDLLDHLPIQACVKMNRRLLTSISSLPTGADRPPHFL